MAYCILYTAVSEIETDEKTGDTETLWGEPTLHERSEASLAATQQSADYLTYTANAEALDPMDEELEEYFVAGPCGMCRETCPGRKDRVAA